MENLLSKHKELFKSNNKTDLQEKRRESLLREHKLKRSLIQDEHRNLHETFSGLVRSRNRPKKRTFKDKYGIDYSLQLSEWLKEKPNDLSEWILVPCPKGLRCMVIACSGRTEMYTKYGKLYNTFMSLLPGNVGCKKDVTILDCVYVNDKSTFYVLDTISYGNQDLQHCEAQFRFFWLESKLLEAPLDEISPENEYKFVCLEHNDFQNNDSILKTFQQFPLWTDDCPALDGYLFYHKEASYTCGTTPLVGWLFSFMIPEVLGYTVNTAYMDLMPSNYIDYLHYIVEFDEMMTKRRNQKRGYHTHKSKMEEDDYRQLPHANELNDSEDDYLKLVIDSQRDLELEEGIDCCDENQ